MDADLFRFTTTELQGLHLAIMFAFEQSAVLAPTLGLDQIRAAALGGVGWDDPIPDEVLQRALASLTGWELLEAGMPTRPTSSSWVGCTVSPATASAEPLHDKPSGTIGGFI